MRSDKELLELAARAAGITNCGYCPNGIGTGKNGPILIGIWNPLTDDGDAFRLAVKLGFAVRRISNKAMVSSSAGQFDEYCDRDQYAATRRAITRAAAEIGATL